MTTYLLNSAVLTAFGAYEYRELTVEGARQVLSEGFVSAVGHSGSSEFCSALLGLEVPLNRITITMQPGDRAVVVRIKERLPEGQVLTREQIRASLNEIGLLVRER